MPLFYQQYINQFTKLAIWKIEEKEDFFIEIVPLQNNITHPHKRLQHLAGRFLLKFLFNDFPSKDILIADTKKPFLVNEKYHFSISHCGDFAAAIVSSKQRVGIDIEIPVEKIFKISHKFLNDFELNNLKIQHSFTKENLTLIWSTKEAMFKWYGAGNIDFKKMLQTTIINFDNEGDFFSKLKTEKEIYQLKVNYKFFEELILTFITK